MKADIALLEEVRRTRDACQNDISLSRHSEVSNVRQDPMIQIHFNRIKERLSHLLRDPQQRLVPFAVSKSTTIMAMARQRAVSTYLLHLFETTYAGEYLVLPSGETLVGAMLEKLAQAKVTTTIASEQI